MSVPVMLGLVLGVGVVLLGVGALMVHGWITGLAIQRARQEDVPRLLETSGRTLTGLVRALRRTTPEVQSVAIPGVARAESERGGEGAIER